MEKTSFTKDGVLLLPPGFRFHPTDEELVVEYLKCKVLSKPLPASIFVDYDVFNSDPWYLPGEIEEEKYFFTTKEVKNPNGATMSGYWKEIGVDDEIVTSKDNKVVGKKKTLGFYYGKPPGSISEWVMHEYSFTDIESIAIDAAHQGNKIIQDNWVLCRVFLKKYGLESEEEII